MRAWMALLAAALAWAGCVQSPGLHVIDGHATALHPDAPGVEVTLEAARCGPDVCLDAVARNDGSTVHRIETGCTEAWRERMARHSTAVAPRAPTASCAGFATREFAPGDEVGRSWTWAGRVWEEPYRRMVPAPEGTYDWTIGFIVHDEALQRSTTLSATVQLRVL